MPAPSPEEQLEYARRRAALTAAIGHDGVAIVPAAREVIRNRDTPFRFRQDSDFWYLTGFVEPEAITVIAPGLTLDGREAEFLMFVREKNPEREIWDGFRAGPEGAVKVYGADQAFVVSDFDKHLIALLSGRRRVFYTLGEHTELDGRITAAVRAIREVSRRGPAAPTEFVALETTLHEQRLVKSEAELELLRKACEVTAAAHLRAMRNTRPGLMEWQVEAEIEHEFARNRMLPGYTSIVGGGANACVLHYVENDAELRDGDLLLIDAGGEYRGYSADITRSFPVNGRYSAAQRQLYEVVLDAQLAAIATLRAGNPVGAPHEVATRKLTEGMVRLGLLEGDVDTLIKDGKHRQFYMHGTGHWLGMDVHDVGRYRLDDQFRSFVPGMVMTVEPGLYVAPGTPGVDARFHGIGIRIEDDVLVTEGDPEVLTRGVPKTVAEIEALMQAA